MTKKSESPNELLSKRDNGDCILIAKMVGSKPDYVRQVLNGDRGSEGPVARLIIEAAKIAQQAKINLIELARGEGKQLSFQKSYLIPLTRPIKANRDGN